MAKIVARKIGELHFECTDPYCLRVAFEIISGVTLNGVIHFLQGGFFIRHSNSAGTEIVSITIYEPLVQDYTVTYDSTIPPPDETCAHVILSRIVEVCKSSAKKDCMIIDASILEGNTIENIHCQKHESNVDNIACTADCQGGTPHDMLAMYYPDRRPIIKITVSKFAMVFVSFKNRKCSSVIVSLGSDNVTFKGYKDAELISGARFSLTSRSLTEYDANSGGETDGMVISNGKTSLIVRDYSIRINLQACGNWIGKIPRLANGNSIVSLFMKERAPLILTTGVGTMGVASFAFTDVVNN
jgi:hypothetical protein